MNNFWIYCAAFAGVAVIYTLSIVLYGWVMTKIMDRGAMDNKNPANYLEGSHAYESEKPIPAPPLPEGERWLRKTDWSIDGIIAEEG